MDNSENQEECCFTEDTEVTDLKLVVENKNLFVNKGVLIVSSSVFKEMFCSEKKAIDELTISDIKYEDMVEFLKCIYPSILKPLSFETVTQVLPLMYKYKCDRQLQQCEEFFIENINPEIKHVELKKLLLYLNQTKFYGLVKAYGVCLEQLLNHFFVKQRVRIRYGGYDRRFPPQ